MDQGQSLNYDHNYENENEEGGFRKCWPRKKVATVGNRLDVGSEKDSGETKITLGFPAGRSVIGWYFPLQRKAGQIGRARSSCPAVSLASANASEF